MASDAERLDRIRELRTSGSCLGELFDDGFTAEEIVEALGVMPLANDLGLVDSKLIYGDPDEWVDKVLDNRGAHCGNCDEWRNLREGLWLEQCSQCGDEEIDIYLAAQQAQSLP